MVKKSIKKSSKKSTEKVFLNIRIPKFIMDNINSECNRLGLNKTSYIIMVLNSYFEGRDILKMGGYKDSEIDELSDTSK